jgi:hypothetical protein
VRDRALVIAGWVAVLGVVGGAWQFAAVHGLIDPVFTGIPTQLPAHSSKASLGHLSRSIPLPRSRQL